VDANQPLLNNSPSPFILPSWKALLSQYPGSLPVTLAGILKYGCQIGYNGPPQLILSQNLKSAHIDQSTISDKLISDLALRRVVSRTPSFPFHLVPPRAGTKGGWRSPPNSSSLSSTGIFCQCLYPRKCRLDQIHQYHRYLQSNHLSRAPLCYSQKGYQRRF
jgi:hypothetical protein